VVKVKTMREHHDWRNRDKNSIWREKQRTANKERVTSEKEQTNSNQAQSNKALEQKT
jgi:hypothetical protein